MRTLIKIIAAFFMFISQSALALDLISVEGSILESAAQTPGPPAIDQNWQPFSGRVLETGGRQWFHMELTLELEEGEQIHNPLALGISLMGVYDFYWDGELIGSNHHHGAQANRASRVMVPVRSLTPGRHVMRMRISPIGMEKGDNLDLFVQPAAVKSDFFGVHHSVITTFFVATAGIFTGCYLLLLWRSGNARPGLLSAITMSFAAVALILLQEGRYLFSYPYAWQPVLDNLIPPLALMVIVLLPWFTVTRLGFRFRLRWMGGIFAVVAASFLFVTGAEEDMRALVPLSISLLALSFLAWQKGRKTARFFVVSFALALIALWLDPDQKHLFLIVIILLLAVDLAMDIKRRAAEAVHHALVSERLRADLIKRNIQPHFLMNSLTALMEWVETAPGSAVEFIDGLAAEFRLLSDFAERSAVSLSEELALCEIHLNLMALRLDGKFAFKTSTVDRAALIPPGIFHTLLENAFSHNAYAGREIAFELTYENSDGFARYTLLAPISGQQATGMGAGTGSRYVRARLEEFCGNAFRFSSEPVGSHWITTIEIGSFER